MIISLVKQQRDGAMMNLLELAAIGTQPQVAPTRGHAQLANVTDPQDCALLIALEDGSVRRGGGDREISVATLNALGRKGLLKLTAHPGTRRSNWAFGELTNAGRKRAEKISAQHN
jgi:hypothetical protein